MMAAVTSRCPRVVAPLFVAFLIGTSAYAADEKTAAPVPQAVAALACLAKHVPVVESGAYGWNTGQYSYDAAGKHHRHRQRRHGVRFHVCQVLQRGVGAVSVCGWVARPRKGSS
jgi:hypothetical protein